LVAPYLAQPLEKVVLDEVVENLRRTADVSFQSWALSLVAPYLSEELLMELVAICQKIRDKYRKIAALSIIIPYLSEDSKQKPLVI